MAKKKGKGHGQSSAAIRPKMPLAGASPIEHRLFRIERYMVAADFARIIPEAEWVLAQPEATPTQRGEALERLGMAHAMQQEFDASYRALTEALVLMPDESTIWYNRSISCRFTMRIGQSLRDMERALELEQDPHQRKKFSKELEFSQGLVDHSLALRGPDFTVDNLIEQEERFQTAVDQMQAEDWAAAEASFRPVIAAGDCLPQPWGNLGMCLLMQGQIDAAEAALHRALEMDPDYEIARNNLLALANVRRTGQIPESRISHPFAGKPVKTSITFTQ